MCNTSRLALQLTIRIQSISCLVLLPHTPEPIIPQLFSPVADSFEIEKSGPRCLHSYSHWVIYIM